MTQAAVLAARQLIDQSDHGVMSTITESDGSLYPFGSVVPFVCNRRGCPVLLLSRLAEHSKNIALRPEVSFLLQQQAEAKSDVQTLARVTLMATAQPMQDEESQNRYFDAFPQSRMYFEQLDFEFFCLNPVKLRYIAGFGKAHWLAIDQVFGDSFHK